MEKNDKLFSLIKSMTRSEKGYFKKLAEAVSQSSDLQYMHLFDALESLNEPEESKLLKKLRGKPRLVQQLPMHKQNLYNNLLKALRLFHDEAETQSIVFSRLNNARLLTRKWLHSQALDQCQKAADQSSSEGDTLHSFLSNAYERMSLFNNIGDEWEAVFNQNIESAKEQLEALRIEIEIDSIYGKLLYFARTEGIVRTPASVEKIESLFGQIENLSINPQNLGSGARIAFFMINKIYYEHKGDIEQSFDFMLKIFKVYEEFPVLQTRQKEKYVNTINNLFSICLKCQKRDFLEDILSNLSEEIKTFDRKNDYRLYEYQAEICLYRRKPKAVEELVEDLYANLGKGIQPSTNERLLLLKYNMLILFFLLEKHGQALDICEEFIENRNSEIRKNLQIGAMLFKCLILYRTGELQFLESVIRSTRYFLIKENYESVIIGETLSLLSKLLNVPDEATKKKAFEKTLEIIEKEAEANPLEANILSFFNVGWWLKAELAKIAPLEIVFQETGD